MGSSTKSLIKDVVIIVVAIAVIWLGLQAVFGTSNPFYVVSSGSMIPALEVYDVIVVEGNTPFEDIEKGDIIVFYSPKLYEQGKERVIVHRVSLDMSTDAQKIVRTKGDANPSSIAGTDYPITEKEYLGQVEYVIPQVGYITQILQPPINYIIIAVIIGVMVVKHFAGKEKKKIEFQYTKDSSEVNEPDNSLEENKDESADNTLHKEIDDDSPHCTPTCNMSPNLRIWCKKEEELERREKQMDEELEYERKSSGKKSASDKGRMAKKYRNYGQKDDN